MIIIARRARFYPKNKYLYAKNNLEGRDDAPAAISFLTGCGVIMAVSRNLRVWRFGRVSRKFRLWPAATLGKLKSGPIFPE